MSTDYLKKQLMQLELSESEAGIYLACLKFSSVSPTQLAKITEIKRSTLYLHLDKLKSMGLVSTRIQQKKRYIIPAPVISLKNLVEEKRINVEKQLRLLSELIPQLEKVTKDLVSPGSVEILEGEVGMSIIIEKIIKAKKDIYWIGSIDTLLSAIPDEKFFKLLTWRRMDQGTTAFAITDKSILSLEKYSNSQGKFRKMKILKEKIDIPGVVALFDQQLAFVSVKNSKTYIVLISEAVISEMFLFMFKQLWEKLD